MLRILAAALASLVPSLALATTYQVGATRSYTSPCKLAAAVALMPGDEIDVDAGKYTDACQLTASGTATAPIVMRGAAGPRPVFDATGIDLSGSGSVPRAIFQFTNGSFWLLEHLEFENAANASNNGAAFRVTAGAHDITVRDLSIHDNQDGAMSDGVSTIVIESCDIFANGANDGQSHNLYLQGETVRLVGNHIHDSRGGQNVKLRTRYVELFANVIENAGNYEIDLIQGPNTAEANANAILVGNLIVRAQNAANNSQTILFGTDNPTDTTPSRNGALWAINNTFVMRNASNRLFHVLTSSPPPAPTHVYLYNNIVHADVAGTDLTADTTTAGYVSGSNNFITTGIGGLPATLTATITGVDPGFVGGGDWHLAMGAPAADVGLANPTYVDGTGATVSGVPMLEPTPPIGSEPRFVIGAGIDDGAFELFNTRAIDAGASDDGFTPFDDMGNGGLPPSSGGGGTGGKKGCSCNLGGAASEAPPASLVVLLALAGLAFRVRFRRLAKAALERDHRRHRAG